MLHFLKFFGVLVLAGFLLRTLWKLAITPLNRHFVLSNAPTGLIQSGWLLLQIYVVGWWAILCLYLARLFSAGPGVEHRWVYYSLACCGCVATLWDYTGRVTNTIAWFSFAVFAAVAFFPVLSVPWAWFFRLL